MEKHNIYLDKNFDRVSVHDPTIVKDRDGKYYIFGSHLAAVRSDDLIKWEDIGGAKKLFGVKKIDLIMDNIKSWMNVRKGDLGCWAADVIYNRTMKKYCFYACSSQFGITDSVIWFATADNIEGPYSEATPIVYSGFSNEETGIWSYKNTNIKTLIEDGTIQGLGNWFKPDGKYNDIPGNMPNAIDPGMFYDKNGRMWMTYGSYFGGIYLLEIDVNTGIPIYPKVDKRDENIVSYFGRLIATSEGCYGKGEGPYIMYNEAADTYYLYITYGDLAGNGGYNVRVFKSDSPEGPYVDAAGNLATDKVNKGLKMMGNYEMLGTLPYISPGHTSAMTEEDTGKIFHVYHTRLADGEGKIHQIRVHQMFINESGFTVVLPYEYYGENIAECKFRTENVAGEYSFVNHGNDNTPSDEIKDVYVEKEKTILLKEDGTIDGQLSGIWKLDDKSGRNITIEMDGVTYSGIFCKQFDETENRQERIVFAAAGTNNCTIWGVKK